MKKPHRKQGEAGFFIFLGQGLWESNDNMDSLTRRILQNFEFIFRKPPTHTSQQKGISLQQWKLCSELPSSIVQKKPTPVTWGWGSFEKLRLYLCFKLLTQPLNHLKFSTTFIRENNNITITGVALLRKVLCNHLVLFQITVVLKGILYQKSKTIGSLFFVLYQEIKEMAGRDSGENRINCSFSFV